VGAALAFILYGPTMWAWWLKRRRVDPSLAREAQRPSV